MTMIVRRKGIRAQRSADMPPGPVSGREKAASEEAAFSNPELMGMDGAPGAIRTPDPLVRSQIL
ncbi:hypothetical protein, partial [Microvirgula aerodenitrificans]|uniref:hypothetical protein n=1 Tax=Microvirgula aerodenitrificans TaxID=57480 RepID=UPI00248E926D